VRFVLPFSLDAISNIGLDSVAGITEANGGHIGVTVTTTQPKALILLHNRIEQCLCFAAHIVHSKLSTI
jgi:hypothetical protein